MTLIETIAARKTAWKIGEMAELLSISKVQLYKMVRKNEIPHFKLAGVKFDPKTTADWLRERTL